MTEPKAMNKPSRKGAKMEQSTIDFSKETVIFMDEEMFTTIGAIKVMGIGKTTLSKEIRDSKIEVFQHPGGNLFSKGAILEWVKNRTKKRKPKSKG